MPYGLELEDENLKNYADEFLLRHYIVTVISF